METEASSFEVRCDRCRVSFPIGTKKCVHCGERIGRPRALRVAPTRSRVAPTRSGAAPPPPILDEMGEEDLPTRGGFLSPVAILWIVLILGSAIYRACS